ncbi:MAG: glycosyltransferase [Fibrobacter sp.]|nr:glycosyltransferase [Fibrobacter sp.]
MKPRILILMHYMELGGAESALLGLLQSVDSAKADVDVFIYDHRGEFMPLIPKDKVNLLPQIPAYTMLERPIKDLVKKGFWRLALARILGRRETAKNVSKNINRLDDASGFFYQARRTVKCLPKIQPDVEYDLAISFLTPHFIVLDKVSAKKKIGWIHTDYTKVFVDTAAELEMWNRLDNIVSISPDVSKKFCEVFPSLENKIVEIENILSPEFIRTRAELGNTFEMMHNGVKLLTIGRYSPPKNMENIPEICRKLVDAGYDIYWYIIGYGSSEIESQVRENADKFGVADRVVLLGKRDNPYPYIKACDIYVQPSRYEGKSITVREAQILCKPVLITNYPTAKSQVQNDFDGVIAPLDNENCAKALAEFINDKDQQRKIVEYLATHDYGNTSEIEKIYKLAEV